MEFRVGACTSCNKKFKVPATFQSDKAKCKHCGGVVEIGALASSAKPKPAAKPVPVPAKKAAAAKPARPGVQAAAAAGAAKAAAVDSVRGKARAAGQRVKAAGTKAAAPAAKAGAKAAASARAGARTSSPRASSGSSSRRSRAKPAPKKSPVGMIVGIVVLVAAVGAGAFFMLKGGDDNATQAAETNLAQAETNPLAEQAPVETAPAPVESEPEIADPEETEKPVEPDPEPPTPAQPEQVVLLDLLEELPDLEPLPGTDPERAQQLRQWMAEYIDPNAGAAGSRAGKALRESPKESFPFIINAFKRIDTTTEDGFRAGDLTQKLLERICHGNNFDWKYPAPGASTLEPKDVLFNQKVVKAWHNIWLQAKDDEAIWLKLTKQAAKPEETKKAPKLDDF